MLDTYRGYWKNKRTVINSGKMKGENKNSDVSYASDARFVARACSAYVTPRELELARKEFARHPRRNMTNRILFACLSAPPSIETGMKLFPSRYRYANASNDCIFPFVFRCHFQYGPACVENIYRSPFATDYKFSIRDLPVTSAVCRWVCAHWIYININSETSKSIKYVRDWNKDRLSLL